MPKIKVIKIVFDKSKFDRRDWIKYLVYPTWHDRELGNIVEKIPETAFNKFVENQVDSYIAGKIPPEEIMPAVMNLADDHLSGKEMTLRSGDYAALQGYFRKI